MPPSALSQQLFPRALPLPAWLPPHIRARLAGRTLSLPMPRQVRQRLRSPEKIGGADWAARYRVVGSDSAHPGPWRSDYAPHTKRIMDTFAMPWVREIWFCAVEQSGKTNTMLNCMGWCIDCDPGNIFYLMPTEATAQKVTGEKIKPLLALSPRLARHLSRRQDDTTMARIKLDHGVTIWPAHANSASSMATWAAKHCFGDEVDKYPPMVGKEADPITLLRKRNRTYRGRYKRFFASSPGEARLIHKGMLECHQAWEYRLCCPHCKQTIRPDSGCLTIPDDATPSSIEQGGFVCSCPSCGVSLSDDDRERAIRAGGWHCLKGADNPRPARVGFHHRAWDCLDIPLAEIATAWHKAQTGGVAEKTAWANGYEAENYEADQVERQEDYILRLVNPAMPRGVCPRDPSCIVVLADTQQRGFFYQVWAYGWGREMETWRLDHGFVEEFDHLRDIAAKTWIDADGKEYRASAGFIDSGGGTNPYQPKHSRTAEVYEFCRVTPFFRPLKGRRDMAKAWNSTRLDYYPSRTGKKTPIPGGLTLYTVNVTMLKNELSGKLQIEPGDPGAFHLHAEMGSDYAQQMCAEYRDERGWWLCPRHKANHHWDISVYGLAAAEILRIRDRRPDSTGPRRKIYSKGVQR